MIGHVLITRQAADCTELEGLLTPRGATVTPYPVLRVADVADDPGWAAALAAVPAQAASSWLILASPRAPHR